jgi:RNA polymerase sigma factor (sigma-70 family)
MTGPNPLAAEPAGDAEDQRLVAAARAGDQTALEQLVERHQRWIYNIVRRMTYNPADAEDATQEVLIKVVTRLSAFEGRSSFRTWLYRIVVNHVLNMRRGRSESHEWTFDAYERALRNTPDADIPDTGATPADTQLLIQEAQVACTTAMLLCLDREQRLTIILGEVLGVSAPVAAELLEVTPDTFRQRLARARRDLYSFLHGKCGLVDQANPCRCAKKTYGFMQSGYVSREHPIFLTSRVAFVRDVAPDRLQALEAIDDGYGAIFRDDLFLESPDFVSALRGLVNRPGFRSVLDT